jgi:hemoglobin-like flavoprotein
VTPQQVKLVQDSLAKVAPISDKAAALFYGRLFEIAPNVRALFQGDMTAQGRKLMTTLAAVVNGLSNLESILPAASALAKRHVHYGVKADHYQPVGAALAVDPGARTWYGLDAASRRRMDGSLQDARRLYDC